MSKVEEIWKTFKVLRLSYKDVYQHRPQYFSFFQQNLFNKSDEITTYRDENASSDVRAALVCPCVGNGG